jgi:sugar phosphate isomerase/epimerase
MSTSGDHVKWSILDHRIVGWYYPWIMKGLKPTSSPLEKKMRLMKGIGFDGVGTTWWELVAYYQERGELEQLRALSAELGFPLAAYGFVAEGWAFGKGEAQKNAISLAMSSLDLAYAAGCQEPFLMGPSDSGDIRDAAQVFGELCQYAAQYGMNLGLEFLGPAHQVKDIRTAWEVIDQCGQPNAGLAIDTYHFFAGGSSLEDLQLVPPSKVFVVHFCDVVGDLKDPALEWDRVMPGEGRLPLRDFVQVLLANEFEGYWQVECINVRDYAADLREVACRALAAGRSVVQEALGSAK